MRLVYAGTPAFAVASLEALLALRPRHELVAVVTQPDRPRGRSRHEQPPPVKEAALVLGFPADRILQPLSINAPYVLGLLGSLEPDLICVSAYGGLFKSAALALPKRYCLGAHASLLPGHRGASPIQAAILEGDTDTGVSILKMVAALDAGPLLLQRAIPIAPDETSATLHDRLARLAGECFVEAVRLIEQGGETFTPQDASKATYAPKLMKDSGHLDWSRGAEYLERFVRAMTPWPGAWCVISAPEGSRPLRLRVGATGKPRDRSLPREADPGHGWLLAAKGAEPACLEVLCGDGRVLPITAVQPEGRREMSVQEFMAGAGQRYAYICRFE